MTIEDIRKENQSVFDKIDATTPIDKRQTAYSSAYADILYETRKKAHYAENTLDCKKNTFIGIIITGIVLAALGVFIMLSIKMELKTADISNTSERMINLYSKVIPAVLIVLGAIVITIDIIVRKRQKNTVKKYEEQVAFLERYSSTDKDMRFRIQSIEDSKAFHESIKRIIFSPSKRSSSTSSSSSSSSSSSASEQSSGGYFSSPSNRVNYKDGYRDAGYSENGKMYDSNNRQIGYIDDNDKVYDNNYNAVGWFDDNGTYHNY